MRAILLVLLFAVPAFAKKPAKKPVAKKPAANLPESNLPESKLPAAVRAEIETGQWDAKYVEVGEPIDLANAEIKDRAGSGAIRNPDIKEVRAQLDKEFAEKQKRAKIKDIKDLKPEPEWIPVGIPGVAIRVKYNYPLQQAIAQKEGKTPKEYDEIFLVDRQGRVFGRTDSEHFRKNHPAK